MKTIKLFAIILGTLTMMACGAQRDAQQPDITGKWNIDNAMGISTQTAENPTFIDFEANGKMNGNASVNTFNGSFTLNGENLTLSNIGMTRMMGASMDVEDAITQALNNTASIHVDGEKAFIFNASNDTIMVLSK